MGFAIVPVLRRTRSCSVFSATVNSGGMSTRRIKKGHAAMISNPGLEDLEYNCLPRIPC